MSSKYIMILGAGLMQRPSLEAAKQLGYKTLVVDANPKALCASFADRFEPVDLKDKESLASLALSLGEDLAGVFTAGTDFSASVAYVAQKCKLHSHSYEACINASNKAMMRECFKKNNIPSPDFKIIERANLSEFLEKNLLDSVVWPKVVKPVDNMGGRGCRLIRSKEEFLASAEEAIRNSRSSKAIFEDYMEGKEFSIDALLYKDSLTITGFADRHIFFEPYFIEMGHTLPSSCDEKIKLELFSVFANAVKSLGLTEGACKADIKYTKNGPMIGEIAARLSGGYMSGWTYPYSTGLEITKEALLIAVGKEPEGLLLRRRPLPLKNMPFSMYEISGDRVSAERAWISIPGVVSEVYGREKAKAYPFVRNLFSRVENEMPVDFPRNNVQKCGNVITFATDSSLAQEAAETSASQIVLRLKPHEPKTEDYLLGKETLDEKGFPPSAFVFSETQRLVVNSFIREVPRIKKNESVLSGLKEKELDFAKSVFDFNHRSLYASLLLFDEICPKHPELNSTLFWNSLLRGGIQGALYISDCEAKNEK